MMDLAEFCSLEWKLLKMYLDNCPFLFKFALEYAIGRVLLKQDGLKLNVHINLWFLLVVLMHWVEAYILQRKYRIFSSC